MKDIRAAYLDVIECSSTAMLNDVIEQQRIQDLPIISDRDIQLMQWILKKMPVQNCPVVSYGFLCFLIKLKGLIEAKILKQAQAHDAELLELMESEWLRKFEQNGSTTAAKAEVVPLVQTLSKSERFKKIINTSYQTAKSKWEP